MRRQLAVAVVAALTCVTVSAVATDHADARRAPSVVMLTLSPRINIGTHPKFQYSTSGLPAGAVVQLQRQLTATTWKVVASPPPGTNLVVYAPAPSPIGEYVYRMQVLNGGVVIAQTGHDHPVYVFDNISVETLCPHTTGPRECVHTKTLVGGVQVRTHMALSASIFPNYSAGAHWARSSCRSATLIFTNPHTTTNKTWLKVHQVGHADQVGSANRNVLGHLTATLYGGSVYFDGSTENSSVDGVYVDGTMLCWTATGTY